MNNTNDLPEENCIDSSAHQSNSKYYNIKIQHPNPNALHDIHIALQNSTQMLVMVNTM